jgi:hypothetical protein
VFSDVFSALDTGGGADKRLEKHETIKKKLLFNSRVKLTCTVKQKKLFTLLDLCVSSLRRGHANLLCIVPILTDGNPEGNPMW